MIKSIPLKIHYEGRWVHYDTILSDFVERLHSRFTVLALLLAIAILSIYLNGDPIACILPAEFEQAPGWSAYVHSYCLVRGTYRYRNHFEYDKPQANDYVPYYQWVPLFLTFQMASFAFPTIIWTWFQSSFGLGIEYIVCALRDSIKEPNSIKQNAILDQNSKWIYYYFYYRKKHKKGLYTAIQKFPSLFSSSYCTYKVIILLNVLFQFFLLCAFIDTHILWGFQEMGRVFSNSKERINSVEHVFAARNQAQLSNFPKEVRCYFSQVFHSGIHQTHQFQCLLTVNYLHEKLFLALYFWYILLTFITLINIINFVINLITKKYRNELVTHIVTSEHFISRNLLEENAKKFVDEFLGDDGILLFHFIRICVGPAMSSHLLNKVWLHNLDLNQTSEGSGNISSNRQDEENKREPAESK